jgi:outer membrane protein assembly factor BamB
VNWTTPLAVQVKGQTQILVLGTSQAKGYDAAKGTELWSVDGLHFQCIPTPVLHNDLAVICSGVSTLAVRLDGSRGDLTKSRVVWSNKKANAFVPSPILYQGLVYIPGDRGIVLCLDAEKGTLVGKKRLGDSYHASPVAGDGKIYFTSKEGLVHVVKAGADMEILAANDLGETIVASPAVSQRQIFLRGDKHLFCVQEMNAKR